LTLRWNAKAAKVAENVLSFFAGFAFDRDVLS